MLDINFEFKPNKEDLKKLNKMTIEDISEDFKFKMYDALTLCHGSYHLANLGDKQAQRAMKYLVEKK